MKGFLDTLGGLYELVRLAVITRARVRGPYWSWRLHTAFGRGSPGAVALLRSVLAYGRWIHHMRRRTGGL